MSVSISTGVCMSIHEWNMDTHTLTRIHQMALCNMSNVVFSQILLRLLWGSLYTPSSFFNLCTYLFRMFFFNLHTVIFLFMVTCPIYSVLSFHPCHPLFDILTQLSISLSLDFQFLSTFSVSLILLYFLLDPPRKWSK